MNKINVEYGVVSCLIPCYNSEVFIDDCLKSILNQTYKKIELIFIDDGSNDNTYIILMNFKKLYENKFVNVIICKHTRNKGICAAINTGIRYVHGEYLCWFDSDDILEDKCIEKKVDFLKKNNQYQCVMAKANIFRDKISNVIGTLGNEEKVGNIFENYLFQYCSTSSGLNMTYTNVLFPLLPAFGIREDITEQNWYLMLLLAAKVNIGFIDEFLYYYRINDNSDSHKNPVVTGLQYKKFWDQVDRIRFYAINDSLLPFSYKCRAFKLQAENSISDRLYSIDDLQVCEDKEYVNFIAESFLENGNVINSINDRDVYIYGTSSKQKLLSDILGKYIKISGFIDSYCKDMDNNIENAQNIDFKKMYIIIPLQYHKEIIELLMEKEGKNGVDYYYPKEYIYNSVKKYKNFKWKEMQE